MADKNTPFETLQNIHSFETKSGEKRLTADARFFLGKDSEYRKAGEHYVVQTFGRITGENIKERLDEALGADVQYSEEYDNVTANVSYFVLTEAEAIALAGEMKQGVNVQANVTLSAREYKDKFYVDIRINTPYFTTYGSSNPAAEALEAEKSGKSKSKAKEVEDDDLPF